MSEITLPSETLAANSSGESRRLRGNLGVASIVVMVVAAGRRT